MSSLHFTSPSATTLNVTMATEDHVHGNNKTFLGVESDGARYTWGAYLLFVIVSSLVGDTAILIGSIKYRALKLHKVITVIIQHIAVCDLMVCGMDVIPNLVAILSKRQNHGFFSCYVGPFARSFLNPAAVILICNMTISKLLLLQYPLRSGRITRKRAHIYCGACWLVSLLVPTIFVIVNWKAIYFSNRSHQCGYDDHYVQYVWLKPLLSVVFALLPTGMVVLSTTLLLVRARQLAQRSRESLKWQGLVATVLTATVYCISVLPTIIYSVIESIVRRNHEGSSLFLTHFYRLAYSFLSLNTMSNFYIYTLTVSSFRNFVRTRLQLLYRTVFHKDSERDSVEKEMVGGEDGNATELAAI